MQLRPITSPQGRRLARQVGIGLLAIFGALMGAAVAPAAQAQVGPLTVDVKVRPSLSPGATVDLPPVGSVQFPTHWAPVQVRASIRSVDVDAARAVIDQPAQLEKLTASAPDTVKKAAAQSLAVSLLFAFAGAALLTGLATRSWHGVGLGLAVVAVATLLLGGLTAVSFDSAQLAEPKFTGLLSSAPYVQRRTTSLAERLESYRSGLADFVQSVTTLYAVGQQLPRPDTGLNGDVTTVLHISDLHLNPIGFDLADRLVTQFGVELVVDSGDLSTWGSTAEEGFVNRIGALKVPYVFVRGNHDSQAIADAVARQRNAIVLDGAVTSIIGLRIAGVADPRDLPAEGAKDDLGKAEVQASVERLAAVVDGYDNEHPDEPVQIAVVHDPTRLDALRGKVPLILSGHMHARDVTYTSGTRTMVEGSTGGAGLTADGLRRLSEGNPVPLEATLLYFAKSGPEAGRLLAYDEITVGGLGLTSVSIDRVLVPKDEVNPAPTPTPTTSPSTTSATP
ncbi:metallophosphoesterase family protein [Angustibacter sp. McL0619]|uniref:metallophosphoesterase family protein n=1 Tax=Angustibacter sp. McL0619 TaxID=3415676 RepID=UPI003CF18340